MARITGIFSQDVNRSSAFAPTIAVSSLDTNSWHQGAVAGFTNDSLANMASSSSLLKSMGLGGDAVHGHSPEAVMHVQKLII